MTNADIIRMAREAGAVECCRFDGEQDSHCAIYGNAAIERFAELVAEAERERCAQTCEAWGHECHGEGRDDSEAFDCADAIRSLSDTEGGAA